MTPLPTTQLRGVLIDLDDTLYPQAEFLALAWFAVAERGGRLGLDRDLLHAALIDAAAAGSARGGIIDEAVRRVGGAPDLVSELVAAFRGVRPQHLTPYPGVRAALRELHSLVPIAVITDGAVAGQRAKLAALDMGSAFDAVVLGDGWGREFRKPHPRPFRTALEMLGIDAAEAVMIGDRPDTDIAGAAGLGVRAIRVCTGEYRNRPDHPSTWRRVDTFVDAARLVHAVLPPGGPRRPRFTTISRSRGPAGSGCTAAAD